MTLVRIIKSWSKPDLLLHSPGGTGILGDIRFTLDPVEKCDYLIVLNHLQEPVSIEVPQGNVWCFVQEPPVPLYRWLRLGFSAFDRVYTQDQALRAHRFVHSHGSLPWHVDRAYDWLTSTALPPKKRNLSWVTSDARNKPGHALRMNFLDALRQSLDFSLFGRGFNPIEDKWDALADFRYSIAFENHSGPDYFTEKITDCFLAGTMPLYFGATNIEQYFPKDSLVRIDPADPDMPKKISEIVSSDLAERNREAILEARRRVLEEHQLFARVAALIRDDKTRKNPSRPRPLHLPANPSLTGTYLDASAAGRIWLDMKVSLRLAKARFASGKGHS